MQKTLNDSYPRPVYKYVKRDLPYLKEVLAEAPCFYCSKIFDNFCNIEECSKLTSWLDGGNK